MFSEPARKSYAFVPAQKYGILYHLSRGIMIGSHCDKCGAVSKKYLRSFNASLTSLYLEKLRVSLAPEYGIYKRTY